MKLWENMSLKKLLLSTLCLSKSASEQEVTFLERHILKPVTFWKDTLWKPESFSHSSIAGEQKTFDTINRDKPASNQFLTKSRGVKRTQLWFIIGHICYGSSTIVIRKQGY